jgi:hypothetical protein
MKNKILYCFLATLVFYSSLSPSLASEPSGAIKLGLDLATATADTKSLNEGLKKVGQDKLDEWMWDSIGGYEMLLNSTSEASIPSAKDKLKQIVEVVQNIEKFAIAITEGKYDDALFVAIDQTVSVVNHPLVSVTWAACKMTYESHKLVQSTQAALDIERLYGIVSSDRRLMGVGGSKDSPPQLPETSASADYFFEKYVITDASVRALFKSYVEKEIGESWPEESWGEWAKSWMAIGSGVDTKEAAEIARLAGEWRNKARTWIMRLIKDVNNQAKVYWAQTRARQELAAFKEFQKRVGHFYNNDFEQMVKEFRDIQKHKKALPEYKEVLTKSQQERPKIKAKIDSKDYLKERDGTAKVNGALNNWSSQTYSVSTSASIGGDRQLASALMDESKAWRAMREEFTKEIEDKTEDIIKEQAEDITEAPVYIYSSIAWNQRASAIESTARGYYSSLFEQLIKPFDMAGFALEIEDKDGKVQRVSADPDTAKQAMLDFLNAGRFDLASALLKAWDGYDENTLRSNFNRHYRDIEREAKKIWSTTPQAVIAAEEAYKSKYESVTRQAAALRPPLNAIYQSAWKVLRSCSGYWGASQECWDKWRRAVAPARAIHNQISALWRSLAPFSNKKWVEHYGWGKAASAAQSNLKTLKELDGVVFAQNRDALSEIYNIFDGLRKARREQYERYRKVFNNMDDFFKKEIPGLEILAERVDGRLKDLKENTHTYIVPMRSETQVYFSNLPGRLNSMALMLQQEIIPPQSISYVEVRLDQVKRKLEELKSGWDNLPKLSNDEINQIKVLVNPAFDYAKDNEEIKKNLNKIQQLSSKMRPKVSEFEKLADTDGSNREKDALWLVQNARKIQAFIDKMIEQKHFKYRDGDYRIDVRIEPSNRMVILEEPYNRYATADELEKISAPVKLAWQKAGISSFISKYAPAYARAMEDILNMSDVVATESDNFIVGVRKAVYAEDIQKASDLIASLKPNSENFEDVMKQVAKLLPGVMNIRSEEEIEQMKSRAALYRMTLEEYIKRMRVKPESFVVHDSALRLGPGEEHKIGKDYSDTVKKLTTLTQSYYAYLREKAYQEQQKRYEEEQKKRQAEEEKRQKQAAMSSLTRGLADYYGYYVTDPRINSYSLANARGDVILTHDEVQQGSLTLTGRLTTLQRASKMLISIDGGKSWNELALSESFSYTFNPMPDLPYRFMIRIQTVDQDDFQFDMVEGINSVTYKNISFKQLVLETIKAIAEAYERSDILEFSRYISRDFLGQRVFLEEGVRFDFDMFTDIRLKLYINRIESRSDMYIVETTWQKTQTPRKTGQQQRTTGRTTFMFALEDGIMKIKNLRGDLLYATLSPEIAQASGLSSTVVDEIRTARDERNPVQPGSGDTEEDGGLSTTLTVYQSELKNWESYDFSGHTTGGVGDIDFEGFQIMATVAIEETATAFDDINEVSSVTGFDVEVVAGKKYVFQTTEGYYGKMEILTFTGTGPEAEITFKYAVQTDGSSNVRTR